MKISNFEEYITNLEKKEDIYHWPLKDYKDKNGELIRQKVHERFPFVVTCEGDYYENEEIKSWLWRKIGPRDGQCEEEYYPPDLVNCPIFKEAEEDCDGFWKTKEGDLVPVHNHQGIWTTCWLTKTGYDYGFVDFCFLHEEHMQMLVEKLNE